VDALSPCLHHHNIYAHPAHISHTHAHTHVHTHTRTRTHTHTHTNTCLTRARTFSRRTDFKKNSLSAVVALSSCLHHHKMYAHPAHISHTHIHTHAHTHPAHMPYTRTHFLTQDGLQEEQPECSGCAELMVERRSGQQPHRRQSAVSATC